MRKPILLLLPALLACGDATAARPEIVADFRSNAISLTCEPVDLGVEAAATEIRLATDSTWTLLDGPQLQVLTFTDELQLVRRTPLSATGPAAAAEPLSAALLGDTAVVVAARGQLRLVVLTPRGELLNTIPLDFIPNSLEPADSGSILVTPVPLGIRPPTLLMRHTAEGWGAIPVPKRSYEDMSVNALGNTALVETLLDGRVVVVHQFMSPRGFMVYPDGRVEARAVPTPDGTRNDVQFVPRSPITPEQIARLLIPAMAMTIDPGAARVYLLTRSGSQVDERPERAILQLSDRLEFLRGFTLPVAASSMVYLPRRRAALVVDDLDVFHLCPVPSGGSGA